MPRVLIIAPNWIGDAVMAQPLLKKLASQNFEIDVLATPWVAPIFLACPEVQNVINADFKHGGLGISLRRSIAKKLQEKKYDQAYVLPNSWKSALIPWLAKIPVRIGYQGEIRFGLLNRRLKNPPKQNRPSMVSHYAALAELSNEAEINLALDNPKLSVKQEQLSLARQKINEILPGVSDIFILAPGAEYGPAKQWPLEHFGNLAKSLLENNPHTGIIILGGAKDDVAGQKIIAYINSTQPKMATQVQNMCGKISLSESIALVSLAKGMASNDSGMMHVGAAFEVPQVAFFGSSDPKHTPPRSKFATPLWLGLDCSPCHKRQCPLGHLRCLKEITPESAYQALQKQMTHKG
jgi:heptosyltransferase-2